MQIFRITYKVEDLTVIGYFGVPAGVNASASDVHDWLSRTYGQPQQVTPLLCPVTGPPTHCSGTKWPTLVYCRGGIGRVGRVKMEWIADFVRQGWITFAPCYRGNEGGEGRDEFGGADRQDVIAAIDLLRSMPFAHPSPCVVLGFSRGAINATQAAIARPEDVSHLILWGGVSDLIATYAERPDLRRMLRRVVGGTPARIPAAYESRSPYHIAPSLQCPVLLVHGTNDQQVNVDHSIRMAQRLKTLRLSYEFHCYEGLGHHLPYAIHQAVVDRMLHSVLSKSSGAPE